MLVDFPLCQFRSFKCLVFLRLDYCNQHLASMLEAEFPGVQRPRFSE
jgi:hypothetical protein